MSSNIPIPPELEHLIEKRERDEDRRAADRRGAENRRTCDLGPLGAIETAKSLDELPLDERRADDERREDDRRDDRRRSND